MRKTLVTLLASAALLSSMPAVVHAATSAPAVAAPDAATQRKVDLAKRFFAAIHYGEMMDNMTKSMLPVMFEAMRKQNPAMDSEQSKIASDTVVEVMGEWMPSFQDKAILLYAETFTEEELTQLVTFYESPVGQSIMIKSNGMMPKVMEIMSEDLPGLQGEVTKRLCAKIDCKGRPPAP